MRSSIKSLRYGLGLLILLLLLSTLPAGAITFIQIQVLRDGIGDVDGLDGVRSLTISADGKHIYASGFMDSAIAVFRRDSATGRLAFVQTVKDGDATIDGLAGSFMTVLSADGRHLYASGEADDALAVFERNTSTGALRFVEVEQDGIGGVDGIDGASGLAISPDGRHVYVAGFEGNALAIFSRNITSGRLTFVDMLHDGIDGLGGAYAVTVSADNRFVYVAGLNDDSVVVFRRNTTNGKLTFVQVLYDNIEGIDGLDGAYGVTLSPGGEHIYVPSLVDDAVALFARDATSGRLTFIEAVNDGVGTVDGLDTAFAVAIDPAGQRVYVAGYGDNAVAIFRRDSFSGKLSFIEMEKDGKAGIDGLAHAIAVAISADGRYLYTAGFDDDALAVFSVPSAITYLPAIGRDRQ